MHNQHCPGFVRAAMLSHMTEGNFVYPWPDLVHTGNWFPSLPGGKLLEVPHVHLPRIDAEKPC